MPENEKMGSQKRINRQRIRTNEETDERRTIRELSLKCIYSNR